MWGRADLSKSLKIPCSQWTGKLVTSRAESKKKLNRIICWVLSWLFLFMKETLRIVAGIDSTGQQGTEDSSCEKEVVFGLAVQSLRCNMRVSNIWLCDYIIYVCWYMFPEEAREENVCLRWRILHTIAMAVYAVMNKFNLESRSLLTC